MASPGYQLSWLDQPLLLHRLEPERLGDQGRLPADDLRGVSALPLGSHWAFPGPSPHPGSARLPSAARGPCSDGKWRGWPLPSERDAGDRFPWTVFQGCSQGQQGPGVAMKVEIPGHLSSGLSSDRGSGEATPTGPFVTRLHSWSELSHW